MNKVAHLGRKRFVSSVALALLVGAGTLVPGLSALASGGSAAGGGGAGGGGSTSPAVKPLYTTVSLINVNAYYSTNTAAGQVTFGYLADGSCKSLNFSLSGLQVPDGTVLNITCDMYRPSPVTYYGTVTTVTSLSIIVHNGVGTLDLNSANGDVVPDFPLPGAGTTRITILPRDNSFDLQGSFGAAARKGGGGRP